MGVSLGATSTARRRTGWCGSSATRPCTRSATSTCRRRCAVTSPTRTPRATRRRCCRPTRRRTRRSPTPSCTGSVAGGLRPRSRTPAPPGHAQRHARAGAHRAVRVGPDRRPLVRQARRRRPDRGRHRRPRRGARDQRRAGPRGAQLHRLGVQGLPEGRFTTLPEADDRILATSLVARWRHSGTDVDWNASYDAAMERLLQHLRGHLLPRAAGVAVRDGHGRPRCRPPVSPRSGSRHRTSTTSSSTSAASRSTSKNNGEVFIAADRPYGLIEAQVTRDDAPPAGDAWLHVPGFC